MYALVVHRRNNNNYRRRTDRYERYEDDSDSLGVYHHDTYRRFEHYNRYDTLSSDVD